MNDTSDGPLPITMSAVEVVDDEALKAASGGMIGGVRTNATSRPSVTNRSGGGAKPAGGGSAGGASAIGGAAGAQQMMTGRSRR